MTSLWRHHKLTWNHDSNSLCIFILCRSRECCKWSTFGFSCFKIETALLNSVFDSSIFLLISDSLFSRSSVTWPTAEFAAIWRTTCSSSPFSLFISDLASFDSVPIDFASEIRLLIGSLRTSYFFYFTTSGLDLALMGFKSTWPWVWSSKSGLFSKSGSRTVQRYSSIELKGRSNHRCLKS